MKKCNFIEHIIECCKCGIIPSHQDLINADKELQNLKQRIVNLSQDLFNVNQDLIEETNKYSEYKQAAWVRVNSRGDLYDPRLCCNPHIDKNTILPLYANKEEFKNLMERLKNS